MADKPTKKDLAEIHKQAMKRAEEAWNLERDNVREGREDQKFYAGDQWDEQAKKARGVDRPMLTINRMGTFVRQVTGDIRQNTPAIKVLPARGPASQEKADILNGMIRSIEAESDAAACYVKAATNAAISGQGAFRILTQYVSDKSFDMEIRFQPIADPFGVLIDPFALLPDKSDMGHAWVFERLSKEDFKAKYPDATADDMPIEVDAKGAGLQWVTGDSVRIAEYWCRETTKRTIYQLPDGTVGDVPPKGVDKVKSREVDDVRIVSYMMSGKEILSGPHEWAGKYIPICFVPGEENTIDGATRRKGMIRDAKDPQRLVNYARTTDAESTALQPKAPFIVTVDQIKGYEPIWRTAGTKNHPYLPYNVNPILGANQAPQRSQPPAMSSGLQNLSTQAGQDLHDVFGIYPASLGARSNETSGVAIRARQHEGDTGSNYIPDNTKRAIAYGGRILCDLIPKIYDSQRIVRILKEDGSHEMAEINKEVPDPRGGANMIDPETDISEGEYDVAVSTGPGYATRQQEMADSMIEAGKAIPLIGQVAPDLFVKALNFPGGDEIAKRLERTIPPHIKSDEPMPPPPPSAEDVKDAAEAEKAKAEAEGKMIENLAALVNLQQVLQGVPQQMAAMQQQLAALTGANQMPPDAGDNVGRVVPPPGGMGGPPPDAGPPQMAGPQMNGADGDPEMIDISPMIEGAPV